MPEILAPNRPLAARVATTAEATETPARDLAGALHEVSNALTVVLGWIERARLESRSPGDVEQALDVAARRAVEARDIVRRAIGAEVSTAPARAAAEVVSDAVIGLDPEARRAGIEVASVIAPAAFDVPVEHAHAVVQVLTNLLLNALAVSPRGSGVRVDVRPVGAGERRGLVFGVADQGPGVPVDSRRTLFSAGISTRAGGAGIGLRHAAALARSHGGELTLSVAKSDSDSGTDTSTGARFELFWPASEVAPTPEARSDSTVPAARRRRASLEGARVLLVEDDAAVIDLLDVALTAVGAEVVSVRKRHDLEPALAGGSFAAALFDISPIRDDIAGAIGAVRRGNPAVRIVLISGSAVGIPPLPDDWVAAWVRKPFEVGEILDALEPRHG